MAKLVFVTGPTISGKSSYIREHKNAEAVVFEEAIYGTKAFAQIDSALRSGRDVYVTWILPDGVDIEWVPMKVIDSENGR